MHLKRLSLAILAVCVTGIFSCTKEKTSAPEPTTAFQSEVAMKDYLIHEIGFLPETIEERKDGFVVEGDVYFAKSDFWERYELPVPGAAQKHYRSKYISSVTSVPVNFSHASIPEGWKTAFRSAISKWNGLKRGIKFTEVKGNYCPANGITVQYSSLGNKDKNVFARAGFPSSSGIPYHTVIVNSTCTVSLNAAQRLKTAVHELGHCVGIMHTDVSSGYSKITTATHSCNTGTDVNSVFRQGKMSFTDFSACDKAAIKKLFP